MRKLTRPRKGWSKDIGRLALHTNLSRSWDGWGTTHTTRTGKHVDWYPLAIIPFQMANGAVGVRIYLLWLILWIGWRPHRSKSP